MPRYVGLVAYFGVVHAAHLNKFSQESMAQRAAMQDSNSLKRWQVVVHQKQGILRMTDWCNNEGLSNHTNHRATLAD